MRERRVLRGAFSAPALFRTVPPLTRVGRLLLVSAAVAGVVASIVGAFRGDTIPSAVLQITASVALAFFVWSPVVAVIVLGAVMGGSFFFGLEPPMLLAVLTATGGVLRTATRGLALTYAVALLPVIAAVTLVASRSLTAFAGVMYVTLAVISGGVGVLFRSAAARRRQLELQVAASTRDAEEVAREERVRIADDLHDVIAHDLVAIVMHAHVLETDPEESIRLESQAAIVESARKALTDIRRVVDAAEPAFGGGTPSERSLADELVDARRLLEATGRPLSVAGEAVIAEIPNDTSIVLGRALREAVTNITKHGGVGPVDLELEIDDDRIRMQVSSELSRESPLEKLPSGGYGTVRMRERARLLGGDFIAGLEQERWVARLTVPALPATRRRSLSSTAGRS